LFAAAIGQNIDGLLIDVWIDGAMAASGCGLMLVT